MLDPARLLAGGEERAVRPADRSASWVEALGVLVASARDEGGLSADGVVAFATKIETLVSERLRAEALLAAHPEIVERPLPVRFAVAGMGRSGTTLLQRLLACDPHVAFLPTWQAMRPVPDGDAPPVAAAEDARRAAMVQYVADLTARHPEALRIHPIEVDAPEEEVFLLQHSFASMLFVLSCPLPTYNDWLVAGDHRGAYRFALDLLRLNEWWSGEAAGRPRIMKSPQFLLDLSVVLEVAPDAVIAQTHRDPVDLVGSYCSTYASSRRSSVASLAPEDLGRERLDHLGLMADRAVAVRATAPADRFVDVHYASLVREPFAVVEALYDRAGLALDAEARRRMQAWLDAHPQHQAGRHDYTLADYGLDPDVIEARFERYLQRFAVAREHRS